MKYIIFLICSVITISICPVHADSRDEISRSFDRGKTAYSEGKFEEAAAAFESIVESGYVSGNLYFNLGNAYFRAGDKGRAILNYERAKLLIPRDQDLRFNLRYLQSQVRGPSFKEGNAFNYLRSFFAIWTEAELVWLCFFTLSVVAVLHITGLFLQWPQRRVLFLFISGTMVLVVFAAGLLFKQFNKNDAIILANSPVYFEPRDKATMYFSSAEGEKVEHLKQENEWIKIRRKDGKMGWIKSVNLERIEKILRGDQ